MLVAALIATGFFAFALFLYLDEYLAHPWAALLTGVILLALAVCSPLQRN